MVDAAFGEDTGRVMNACMHACTTTPFAPDAGLAMCGELDQGEGQSRVQR